VKIAVGLFYLECNTNHPDLVTREQFIFAEGQEVLRYLHVGDLMRSEGCTPVPTIMASALPAGVLREKDYRFFADKILAAVKAEPDLDGIWLHLHGALEVENIGSGDLRLVRELRAVVGDDMPIAITLDAHANNAVELADCVNLMRGYHTIPHSDQPRAEQDAVRGLLRFIREKQRIRPALVALPVMMAGEKGLSGKDPLKSLLQKVDELERLPEVETASVFMGDPWCDCPNNHMSVVVVPSRAEHYDAARRHALDLARMAFDKRAEFAFEVPILKPREALQAALEYGKKPVFITDSGDNTTGGASGEGTEMLRAVLDHGSLGDKKVLVTAIYDPKAYAAGAGRAIGDEVSLTVGTGREAIAVPVAVKGKVKAKGDFLGYLNTDAEKSGDCYTLALNPNVDLVLSSVVGSFITEGHFTAAGLSIADYDVIILKQGYLFAQLRPFAATYILALTRGASYQFIEELPYKRVARPIYPLDPDVAFAALEAGK
jgi:microcystin degradation protein MlrC